MSLSSKIKWVTAFRLLSQQPVGQLDLVIEILSNFKAVESFKWAWPFYSVKCFIGIQR
jgi:hypothetical protein